MTASKIKPGLAPGIYFGLPNEVYQDDTALSRTDIVNLIDTPRTYWDMSWMNPERKRKKQTEAMEYGEAFHYLLFQPKEFERRYQVVPIDAWDDAKRKIEQVEYYRIVESIKVLREGQDSGTFLRGGIGEVTIIFEDAGLRFRTRHDYMTPMFTVDFKSARDLHDEYLKREFRQHGLDVQCALYQRARRRFKEQYRAGEAHVYGQVDKKFFDHFMAGDMDEFLFIFQRKTEPYPYEPLMPANDTFDAGYDKIHKARTIFEQHMQQYGSARRWPACSGKTREFSMFFGKRDNL